MSFTSSKNPKTPRLKKKTVAGKRTSRTPAVLDTNLTHFPSILPRCFFLVDALDLSPLLLGKYLRRDDVVLQITEVAIIDTSLISLSLVDGFCCRWRRTGKMIPPPTADLASPHERSQW